ncbi:MAG: ABC transporter permease, partial [Eubacteriales bacterium]|nr:ABC transporter permease [Eubacteriales bacterium]
MLCRLSFRNMKKSFQDYAVYFLTLVLGVAIFYMFNSLDSQQAMLSISSSQQEIIRLMLQVLNAVSVFIAAVLGLLIVYANSFLINRRKKEFGVYMTLGMGKGQISRILLLETVLVGLVSLGAGLLLGVFASQFMSVLVAKMFDADMTGFTFVFSPDACAKTCLYFAVMYAAVLLFNTAAVSRYRLIDLLSASRKNETVKLKNPLLCAVLFLASCLLLGWAYWSVLSHVSLLSAGTDILPPVLCGIAGTVLFFWSLSGLLLRLLQSCGRIYLRGTNVFVLRQLNNRINTNVVSMSVICLMLFLAATVLSTSLSLQSSMQAEQREMTPVDLNLHQDAEDGASMRPVSETLLANGFDLSAFRDTAELPVYEIPGLTMEITLGDTFENARQQYSSLFFSSSPETILRVSDYNKVARLYQMEEYSLADDEYMILCNYDMTLLLRNEALQAGTELSINGKTYRPNYGECQDGFLYISARRTNTGILLVPDSCDLNDEWIAQYFLAANYQASAAEDRQAIENTLLSEQSPLQQSLRAQGVQLNGLTRISILEASTGTSAMLVFIALYLGVVFLVAGAAILALKQLTESSDNRGRYLILRKIGCDERMIRQALFRQIGIFFALPLLLAAVHSVFGIRFAMSMMAVSGSAYELLPSILGTAAVIALVYGLYFLATYLGSR